MHLIYKKMKKFLCLFSALSIALLSSCSSDDDNSDGGSSSTALPTKITLTTVEDGDSGKLDYTFTYDGNKLKEISLSDASRYVYTYTDNLITKVELYKSSVLFTTDVYAYENGKLTSRITSRAFSSFSKDKLTFVYNSNGTVSVKASQILDGEESDYYETTIYTFANGNIVSSEYIDEDGDSEKITSTFDNKKSPFVNVTGLKLLLDVALDTDVSFDFHSVNNALTSKTVYTSEGEVEGTANTTFTNKYNSSDFLTEVFSGDASDSFKVQITY